MVFNIAARNHDDHAKNFGFMLRGDKWGLAPAYDLAYSYKPGSKWVNSHWVSLNGKYDDFVRADFYSLESGASAGIGGLWLWLTRLILRFYVFCLCLNKSYIGLFKIGLPASS